MSGVNRAPLLGDPALREALGRGLDDAPSPLAARLAGAVERAFGAGTRAIVHYGSHVTAREEARPGSALDFFVVVDDYAAAYRALAASVPTGIEPERAARLARLLPPNVVAVPTPEGPGAKCVVLSRADFLRSCSAEAPDHFVQGRLFQHVLLLWSRGAAERDEVRDALLRVRAGTWRWGRPFLPPSFGAEAYVRALLETSFAGEVRPEKADRTGELLAAQGGVLLPAYGALLDALAARGDLALVAPGRFRPVRPASAAARARGRAWFARSKARATLRWAKYVALYDDWLDYIVRKVERRTGTRVELTDRERRWPLLFLWPRVLRFLRERPQNRRAP